MITEEQLTITRTAGELSAFDRVGEEEGLDCLVELRPDDALTGIQFRECLIDYTSCPNRNCIKKLL